MDNIKGTVIEACDQARSRPVLSLVCSFNVLFKILKKILTLHKLKQN